MRLCALFVFVMPLFPATLVTVTSGLGSYGSGVADCAKQSASTAECSTAFGGIPQFAIATATAQSNPGLVQVWTSVGGLGEAIATAQSGNTRQLLVNTSTTLLGIYAFQFTNAFANMPQVLIQQGDTFQNEGRQPPVDGIMTLQSDVLAGIPFTQDMFILSRSSTPGDESQVASIRFNGFTDLAGTPMAFDVVTTPEPRTWLLLMCGIGFIGIRHRRLSHLGVVGYFRRRTG